MSEKAKVAINGDPKSMPQSRIATGGSQAPSGNLGSMAMKGGQIPLNPNASVDSKGVGTH